MPLFHIHGLVAALLASLDGGRARRLHAGLPRTSGSSSWLDELAPTWYTAVPTMHQAILERRARPRRSSPGTRCASSAPPRRRCRSPVLDGLEAAFGVPVDRGLRHDRGRAPDGEQPAPAGRAQARLGRPAGGAGDRRARRRRASRSPPASVGEVAIRGANVFGGYESNPEANAGGVHGRLVPHRRRGLARRRRLPRSCAGG